MSDTEETKKRTKQERQRENYRRWYESKGKEYLREKRKNTYTYTYDPVKSAQSRMPARIQARIEFLEAQGYTVIPPEES
jgi:hypothetical protein